jgi:hypothetical protein
MMLQMASGNTLLQVLVEEGIEASKEVTESV